jgi:hypothetical protein
MLWLHDALNAVVLGVGHRLEVLDDIWLPKWRDRRLGWSKKLGERRHRHVEHMEEAPPVGKDSTKDW